MTCVGAAIPQSSGERGGGGVGADPEVFYPIFVLPIYAVKTKIACVFPKSGKACETPAKGGGGGGFRNFVSPEILAFKGREQAYMRTLNNTEWGGGGGAGENAALH